MTQTGGSSPAVANLSYEEVETLLQIARDATLGDTFEERLRAVTEYLNVLVPSTSLSTMVIRGPGQAPSHMIFRNGTPANLVKYATQYLPLDPMALDGRLERNLGKVVCLSDYAPPSKFGRDAFTGEFLTSQGLRFVLGLSMVMPDGSYLALAMHREAALGDFTKKERRIIELAQTDIGRAAFASLLREKVERMSSAPQGPSEDGAVAGCMVFNAEGDLTRANRAALELCALLGGAQGRFPADVFVAEVRRLAQEPGRSVERSHPLAGGGRVRVRFDSVKTKRGVEVVAELRRERADLRERVAQVAERYQLTRREQQVAELVAQGLGNRHVGYKLGMSEVTVGTHLTSIYRKTGVSGRTDLVRLLLGEAG